MIPRRLADIIVGLVALIWVANFFAQFLVRGYTPDPSINGVFGAVVGGALALTQRGTSTPTPSPPASNADGSTHQPPGSGT